jgi:hypothetical protein
MPWNVIIFVHSKGTLKLPHFHSFEPMVQGGKRCEGKLKLQLWTVEVGKRKKLQVFVHWRFRCTTRWQKGIVAKERRGKKNATRLTLGLTYFKHDAFYNLIGPKCGQSKYNMTFLILNNLWKFGQNSWCFSSWKWKPNCEWTLLFLEFIIISENIVIVEGFDSFNMFQNMLQPFINNHLPL